MNRKSNNIMLLCRIYIIILSAFSIFVLLDTFVIPRKQMAAAVNTSNNVESAAEAGETENLAGNEVNSEENKTAGESDNPVITDSSYEDSNIEISIKTKTSNNTTYYVADIKLSNPAYLKTAFAEDSFGRNIKEKTSEMAENNNAILAINGDYYGFRDYGYVLRNGISYRDTARDNNDDEDLVIDSNGNFSIINENDISLAELAEKGAAQVFSFGPALVEEGKIQVSSSDEVAKSMTANPRTAIGQVDELHYIIIVSDGRTNESKGLSLLQLAEAMKEEGCTTAYNLDGGGSSTLVFNGEIINKPTTNGKIIKEREVSDIVYFGY